MGGAFQASPSCSLHVLLVRFSGESCLPWMDFGVDGHLGLGRAVAQLHAGGPKFKSWHLQAGLRTSHAWNPAESLGPMA